MDATDGALRSHLGSSEREAGASDVGTFIVRTDSPGLTVEPTWDHVGLRAGRSDDVVLDSVPVPADDVIGEVRSGGGPAEGPALVHHDGAFVTAVSLTSLTTM